MHMRQTMNESPSVIDQLEHDHLTLTRLVEDLRVAIQDVLRGDREALDVRDELGEFLSVAEEELYEHFDREEQVLFPYITEVNPEAEAAIAKLEHAHDRMCGAMSRMARIVEQDDEGFASSFDALVALFARFDANFGRHAKEEVALFRSLGSRLEPAELERLRELLAQI